MTRPHVIFHLGQDKTGSTAIQRALLRCDADLQAAGVLFPDPGKHANHQILMPMLSGRLPDDPVQMQTLARSPEAAWAAAKSSWHRVTTALAGGTVQRVIISSEIEFRAWSPEDIAHVTQTLRQISDRIEIVAYLRSPASYLMSVVQQDLKKRPNFRPISASRYRDALEPFLNSGLGEMRVLAFDRKTLIGGDVVMDFCTRFVPEVAADHITAQAEHDNETLSAEAVSLLQGYFRKEVQAPHRWYDARPQRFKRLVMAADAAVAGFCKPQLKPGLAEMACARASDLDWLAETFGVDFRSDTGGMSKSDAEARFNSLRDIEDITWVDGDRRAAMLAEMQRTAQRDQSPRARLRRLFGRK